MRFLVRLRHGILVGALAILQGCASMHFMPLAEEGERIDPKQTVYLMSLQIRQADGSLLQPRVSMVRLTERDDSGHRRRQFFHMDPQGTLEDPGKAPAPTYLVRLSTDGAAVTLDYVDAGVFVFPAYQDHFLLPLAFELPKSGPGVYYLGAVNATLRPREKGESSAGSPFHPYIGGSKNQAFDVNVVDAASSDLPKFKDRFPALKNVDIRQLPLPPWDRATAYAHMEANE